MLPQDQAFWDAVQGVANILAVIVAVVALFITVRTEKRNLDQSKKIADAEMTVVLKKAQPYLHLRSQNYENLKSVVLVNSGLGTAVITNAQFSRKDCIKPDLIDMFDLGSNFLWDTFRRLPSERYIHSGDEIILVKLSEVGLLEQGKTFDQAQALLGKWREQKTGISVIVEYEDIFGNEQPSLTDTLR